MWYAILVNKGDVSIRDLYVNHTKHPAINSISVSPGANLILDGAQSHVATSQSNCVAAFGGGSRIELRNFQVVGEGLRGYAAFGESTLRTVGTNELAQVLLATSNAQKDWGEFDLLDDFVIDIPYRDIRSTDTVYITRIAGSDAGIPSVNISPGVGFSVQGQLGDSSTYTWRLV